MRYLVSEKKMLLALLFIGVGIFLLAQLTLFAAPVHLSEKGLLLGILALCLFVIGFILAAKAIRQV
jgi:uncharacterized membrane protein YiaA